MNCLKVSIIIVSVGFVSYGSSGALANSSGSKEEVKKLPITLESNKPTKNQELDDRISVDTKSTTKKVIDNSSDCK